MTTHNTTNFTLYTVDSTVFAVYNKLNGLFVFSTDVEASAVHQACSLHVDATQKIHTSLANVQTAVRSLVK